MPRAIWKGHVSFGLVEIPVELHSAEVSERTSFSLVDRRDRAPVGYKRVNKRTGEEVPAEEIVKAYATEEGQYVLFGGDELGAARPELTRTIPIVEFVDGREIDPAFWSAPYYLKPVRRKGNRAYVLLRETLARNGVVGVAQVVLRTRQHLAALSTKGPVLTLNLLRYAHEIRPIEELGLPLEDLDASQVDARELAMAEQLVSSMRGEWDPERFHDEYEAELRRLVERKVSAGETGPIEPAPATAAAAEPGARVIDLMPLLKQSVEQRAGDARTKRAPGGRKAAKRARRGSG